MTGPVWVVECAWCGFECELNRPPLVNRRGERFCSAAHRRESDAALREFLVAQGDDPLAVEARRFLGLDLGELPELEEMPPIGGHIFLRDDRRLVVGVGRPVQHSDGSESWERFAVVQLR